MGVREFGYGPLPNTSVPEPNNLASANLLEQRAEQCLQILRIQEQLSIDHLDLAWQSSMSLTGLGSFPSPANKSNVPSGYGNLLEVQFCLSEVSTSGQT